MTYFIGKQNIYQSMENATKVIETTQPSAAGCAGHRDGHRDLHIVQGGDGGVGVEKVEFRIPTVYKVTTTDDGIFVNGVMAFLL